MESPNDSSLTQKVGSMSTSTEQKSGCVPKADEETCPVCQEKLSNQKMVFQCGHVTCCKCKSSSLVHIALFLIWPQRSREH
jgi:E3 ubiquitin-protein ligase SHPRH